jgi:hypothetical protein
MKMRREHSVPLAPQVMSLLSELHEFSGTSIFFFRAPAPKATQSAMSARWRRCAISATTKTPCVCTASGQWRALALTKWATVRT